MGPLKTTCEDGMRWVGPPLSHQSQPYEGFSAVDGAVGSADLTLLLAAYGVPCP